jgi:hypothetical protein
MSFITNPISSALRNYITTEKRGRRYNGFLPSFTPIINSLSTNDTIPNKYTVVYVTGENFFPNGVTYINFGGYQKIPIVFYSSSYISFAIPLDAIGGNYSVVAVNIYNDNFAPPVKYSYPGHLKYSNSLNYFLLHYTITGSYTITSNSDYNTVITLTADSIMVFYNTYNIYYTAVGGGGGGAGGAYINTTGGGGGGGGGGEVITGNFPVGEYHHYKFFPGIGGNGGTKGSISSLGLDGTSGTSSQICRDTAVTFKARGGEGGFGDETTIGNGKGGQAGNDTLGGAGNTNPGGNGYNGSGGGGGAAGAAGGDGFPVIKSIPYYDKVFGAGGGGGAGANNATNGTAGNIYAGSGNSHIDGTANYGGGGGGGKGGDSTTAPTNGGKGGSGIIILMFNV